MGAQGAISIAERLRYEIRRLEQTYDVIVHDCFTGGSEPAHLMSVETLQELRSLLNHEGILAMNTIGFIRGQHALATASIYQTIRKVFPYQRTFVSTPGEIFNDVIFLASRQPIQIEPSTAHARVISWLNQREPPLPLTHGMVISDDFNPLVTWQTQKAEVYRQHLIKRVNPALLIR